VTILRVALQVALLTIVSSAALGQNLKLKELIRLQGLSKREVDKYLTRKKWQLYEVTKAESGDSIAKWGYGIHRMVNDEHTWAQAWLTLGMTPGNYYLSYKPGEDPIPYLKNKIAVAKRGMVQKANRNYKNEVVEVFEDDKYRVLFTEQVHADFKFYYVDVEKVEAVLSK
jgi:hypothetical protein